MFKITFLLSNNYLGGPARVVSELAEELMRRGDEVMVGVPIVPYWQFYKRVTFKKLGLLRRLSFTLRLIFKNLYVELRQNLFKWVADSGSGIKVKRYLLKPPRHLLVNSDFLILSSNWYQVYDIDEKIAHKKQIVQFIHHYDNANDTNIDSLIMNAYSFGFPKITESRFSATVLASKGIKIDHIIPFGVNKRYFYPPSSSLRPINILMYYDTERRKGGDVGIEALKKIKLKFKNIDICLFSPTLLKNILEGFNLKSSISNQELGELYRSHSIFVFPSLLEGFALPPLEAMACGCAVVTTRVGAVEEYAIDKESAIIVEPGDVETISRGIELLLQDTELRLRISGNAVYAVSKFTWQRATDEFEKFIQSKLI